MGWFDFGKAAEDRSLIEISNDDGDHWVADIPTDGARATEKALRKAGIQPDQDDLLQHAYRADRIVDKRDSQQHRYQAARVIDEGEDLESSHDAEADTSDVEYSEQPARWW